MKNVINVSDFVSCASLRRGVPSFRMIIIIVNFFSVKILLKSAIYTFSTYLKNKLVAFGHVNAKNFSNKNKFKCNFACTMPLTKIKLRSFNHSIS